MVWNLFMKNIFMYNLHGKFSWHKPVDMYTNPTQGAVHIRCDHATGGRSYTLMHLWHDHLSLWTGPPWLFVPVYLWFLESSQSSPNLAWRSLITPGERISYEIGKSFILRDPMWWPTPIFKSHPIHAKFGTYNVNGF